MAIGIKSGGRVAGTPNKRTQLLNEILETNSFDVVKELLETIPQLEKDTKAKVLLELMEYIFPKRKAIEHSGPDGDPLPGGSMSEIQFNEMKQELMELIKK